jgi:DNA-binding beta-propeller fold protein YncE
MTRKLRLLLLPILAISGALFLNACKHDPITTTAAVDDGGYPDDINRILVTRCGTSPTGGGCHNATGAPNAGNLRLDTWDAMLSGANHGSVVIPYDTLNSSLLHYINTDSSIGTVAFPAMPYTGSQVSSSPLSRDEYLLIRNWIARGAPDKAGNVPFSENPGTRQKVYLTEQGSDVLSVIDAQRHVIMRNIPIGMTNSIESPHCVRVSPDGQSAYVSFLAGDYMQKIDTRTDKVVGTVQLGSGSAAGSSMWNLLHVSDDNRKVMIADFIKGVLQIVDAQTMKIDQTISTTFRSPHGIASLPGFDTVFITGQYGNTVYKIILSAGDYKLISIDGKPTQSQTNTLDPHEIMMAPDYSKYFLTCEASNEVRVLDTRSDAILKAIPVPTKPQELAISSTKPYIFVTCMEAASLTPGAYGAVVVINYQTLEVVKTIWGAFWQPHGIAVDDQHGIFYVATTNQTGPSSGHNHTSDGKHGWYNVYSLETLEPVLTRQFETLVLPYSADSRFK